MRSGSEGVVAFCCSKSQLTPQVLCMMPLTARMMYGRNEMKRVKPFTLLMHIM